MKTNPILEPTKVRIDPLSHGKFGIRSERMDRYFTVDGKTRRYVSAGNAVSFLKSTGLPFIVENPGGQISYVNCSPFDEKEKDSE